MEIASPSGAEHDSGHKRSLYARSGVREYWLVNSHQETIQVRSLTEAGYELVAYLERNDTLTFPLLPDLKIDLAEVFET